MYCRLNADIVFPPRGVYLRSAEIRKGAEAG
jgi:hypothetical protein